MLQRMQKSRPYTHTTWRVKPGRQDDFVERWRDWADWSHRQGLEGPALLLRDVDDPHTFVSFGPWPNLAAVRNWRTLGGYQERVARLRETIEDFQPRTLEVVAQN